MASVRTTAGRNRWHLHYYIGTNKREKMSPSYIIILSIMLASCYFLFVRKPKTPPGHDPELSKPEPATNPDQDESDANL